MNTLYTGKGDDGTTGLFYGGRVPKDDIRPAAVYDYSFFLRRRAGR